jgi:hypothetical protein
MPSDKVHKMCGGYHEVTDTKLRQVLGFGLVDWSDPDHILLAIMLPICPRGTHCPMFVSSSPLDIHPRCSISKRAFK